MKTKIYIYGLCNVFYDGFYIQGLKEKYNNFEFNISKFPNFGLGTFAYIIENDNQTIKVIIDSRDSNEIRSNELEWCDVFGKINYNEKSISNENKEKIVAIGPSFGIKIWNFADTIFYSGFNFIRFRKHISNKREFIANYWRQYKRLKLKDYNQEESSQKQVFFINSIWKLEKSTNSNRALFIEACKNNPDIDFEGGFVARLDGDNLGFDSLICSEKISLKNYIKKIKNSAFVYNTPAVVSCHGWKLGEFLALGKAIISSSHINTLPQNLENNKHLMYAENSEEIKNAIAILLTDIDFKKKLEFESKNYFDKYLAPKKVISVLEEHTK